MCVSTTQHKFQPLPIPSFPPSLAQLSMLHLQRMNEKRASFWVGKTRQKNTRKGEQKRQRMREGEKKSLHICVGKQKQTMLTVYLTYDVNVSAAVIV